MNILIGDYEMKSSTEELLALIAVVDTGSITKAAEYLGQTTSGISRALSRLESKLNVTLLTRTTRRLTLTAEGQRFVVSARKIVASIEEAEEALLPNDEQLRGTLRVDAASPFVLHCIVPFVPEFHRLYPYIQLELTSHERSIDLIEQKVDIAIRIGSLTDSSMHARYLGDSAIRVLASPNYLAQFGEPRSLLELQQHTLIGFTAPSYLNEWPLSDNPHSESLKVEPNIRALSGETIRQLALVGAGIASLSHFMTYKDIADNRLIPIMLPFIQPKSRAINAIYYRNKQQSRRMTCFLDFIQEKLRESDLVVMK